MLNIKEAYEILGLKEGSSKDEIIKRYDILLKKYKTNAFAGDAKDGKAVTLEDINKAYNILMGYDSGQEDTQAEKTSANPLLKKMNLDEKKVSNFWYYYKVHILVGLAIILIISMSLKSCLNRVNPDLNITLLGNLYTANVDVTGEKVKAGIPELKAVGVDVIQVTDDPKSEQDMAMAQKAMVIMAAGDVDVFILDKVNFERYGKSGAFMNLDSLAGELGIDRTKNTDYIIKTNEDPAEHLYGIDMSSNGLLNELDIQGKEKILAIKVNAKHYDNAVKFVKLLLK